MAIVVGGRVVDSSELMLLRQQFTKVYFLKLYKSILRTNLPMNR